MAIFIFFGVALFVFAVSSIYLGAVFWQYFKRWSQQKKAVKRDEVNLGRTDATKTAEELG